MSSINLSKISSNNDNDGKKEEQNYSTILVTRMEAQFIIDSNDKLWFSRKSEATIRYVLQKNEHDIKANGRTGRG